MSLVANSTGFVGAQLNMIPDSCAPHRAGTWFPFYHSTFFLRYFSILSPWKSRLFVFCCILRALMYVGLAYNLNWHTNIHMPGYVQDYLNSWNELHQFEISF